MFNPLRRDLLLPHGPPLVRPNILLHWTFSRLSDHLTQHSCPCLDPTRHIFNYSPGVNCLQSDCLLNLDLCKCDPDRNLCPHFGPIWIRARQRAMHCYGRLHNFLGCRVPSPAPGFDLSPEKFSPKRWTCRRSVLNCRDAILCGRIFDDDIRGVGGSNLFRSGKNLLQSCQYLQLNGGSRNWSSFTKVREWRRVLGSTGGVLANLCGMFCPGEFKQFAEIQAYLDLGGGGFYHPAHSPIVYVGSDGGDLYLCN